MLAAQPTVEKPDYAKWMLDDPRVNLAISQRTGNASGVDHLGIQAETGEELDELYHRLGDASYAMLEEKGAKCCYAESDKHWAVDPAGVTWEMFHTMGAAVTYGEDHGKVNEAVAAMSPQPHAEAPPKAAGCGCACAA